MSRYPAATDPADSDTLQSLVGKPTPADDFLCINVGIVRENGHAVSAWIMRRTKANVARYDALFDSENPPTDKWEALERAGATFYPRWYDCEIIRGWGTDPETKTTRLVRKHLPRTEENIRLAELELQENAAGMDDGRIDAERRSLARVKQEMMQEEAEASTEAIRGVGHSGRDHVTIYGTPRL